MNLKCLKYMHNIIGWELPEMWSIDFSTSD